MAKITIYDLEGNPVLRESVDARECVESGGYSYEPLGDESDGDESGGEGDTAPVAKTKAPTKPKAG